MTFALWLKQQLISLKIHKRGTQVYVVSYPKSGRTWLRLLMGKAICLDYALPESHLLDTYRLTQQAGLPRTHFIHDYASLLAGFSYRDWPADKSRYAEQKVLLLMRDVRDVLVSSYFQATRRTHRFQGTLSEFVRSERFGIKKVLTFYNTWQAQQHVPRDFLLLRYEALHSNTAVTLQQALHFIGMETVSPHTLQTAVAFASFNNMKRLEMGGFFDDPSLRPANPHDPESYKVRRGVVGGHVNYLSPADNVYIDAVIAEMGNPFA